MAQNRVQNGIHVSNHPDRYIEEMMLVTRPTGAAVVLHQLMLPDDAMLGEVGGDADNGNWLPLRVGRDAERHGGWDAPAAPERLLIVRVWNANNPFQFDPRQRAEYIARRLERWSAHGYPTHNLLDDPYVAIQATNEANIEPASSLGLPPTERYDRIARWEHAFWDAFDRAAPGRRCLSCGPNLAAGHDWRANDPDSEYDHPGIYELCRRHIETGGLLGIHVYYHAHRPWERGGPGEDNEYWYWFRPFRPAGWRDALAPELPPDKGGVVVRFPDARFAVTEAGTWRHHDPRYTSETLDAFRAFLDRAASTGRFAAFCPFIWDTAAGAHPQNRIADNAPLRAGLVEMRDRDACDLARARPGWSSPVREEGPAGSDPEPRERASAFAWPVGESAADRAGTRVPPGWVVSLGFGEDYELDGRRVVHPGLDLNLRTGGDSDLGRPVYACAAGVVVASSYWPVWGNIVLIKHRRPDGSAVWTQYAHLRQRMVDTGDQVTLGAAVGTIGKGDGDRYSAHLHFEVRAADIRPEYWPGTDRSALARYYLDPATVLGTGQPPDTGEAELAAKLRAWADAAQVIRPNESAALLRAIRADGFYPLSDEADVSGVRAQLARSATADAERIYYARIGAWHDVRWIHRRR